MGRGEALAVGNHTARFRRHAPLVHDVEGCECQVAGIGNASLFEQHATLTFDVDQGHRRYYAVGARSGVENFAIEHFSFNQAALQQDGVGQRALRDEEEADGESLIDRFDTFRQTVSVLRNVFLPKFGGFSEVSFGISEFPASECDAAARPFDTGFLAIAPGRPAAPGGVNAIELDFCLLEIRLGTGRVAMACLVLGKK